MYLSYVDLPNNSRNIFTPFEFYFLFFKRLCLLPRQVWFYQTFSLNVFENYVMRSFILLVPEISQVHRTRVCFVIVGCFMLWNSVFEQVCELWHLVTGGFHSSLGTSEDNPIITVLFSSLGRISCPQWVEVELCWSWRVFKRYGIF